MECANGHAEQGQSLKSIFCTDDRAFLIKNNGDQVKLEDQLKVKVVGVYFSAHWCGPCRSFTPKFVGVYNEINDSPDNTFEVVFVSGDETEDSFQSYFEEMPWLAVPFSDSATRDKLNEQFQVRGIPHLVLLDGNTGSVIKDDAVEVVREYGAEAYPFTKERVEALQKKEEEAKKNQTITSVLTSSSRGFVISNDGNQVPVSELKGKMVGIYFSASLHGSCRGFTPILAKMFTDLKARRVPFEIVLVSLDSKKEIFDEAFKSMPWLAVPFEDKSCERLLKYFELDTLPTLVIIGPDGKTIHLNVADYVEEHGADAYPFSQETILQLDEIEKARRESQTLESLLISGELDYVLGKNGLEVPVMQLVGKTIMIYFSAHWCPPCRGFTPKLAEVYNEIKDKHHEYEVIFVSSDRDQSSFDEYYSEMPWLALPFGDTRKKFLSRKFKVQGIPTLVAIGTSGKTVTTEARGLVMKHGAKAFPFTDERLKELEEELEKEAGGWPEKVKHELHEHELVKTRRNSYCCDGCEEGGSGWSFYCWECDFDMHPNCALKRGEAVNGEAKAVGGEKEEEVGEGYVCDGDVCHRA